MRKIIYRLLVSAITILIAVFPAGAKGNTVVGAWEIENPDIWELAGNGENFSLRGIGEGYAGRVVYAKKLDSAQGFYIQWDISWEPGYEMETVTWSLKAVGAEKDFRFGSRVKSLCGMFSVEISYSDGWKSQWVPVPVTNANWKRTDFFARMVIWSKANSKTLNIEARNTKNELIFSSQISEASMTASGFFTYPLEFWVGGDDSKPFCMSNITVLDEYTEKTAVPEEAADLTITPMSYTPITVPPLLKEGDGSIQKKEGFSVLEIGAMVGGGVLLVLALIASWVLLRKSYHKEDGKEGSA